ncbi:unnamed protein product [Ranitomeya imitator]|uniref:Uncharacterized protein n=1 Tax=Ranitomeya imitator TaxID=111125 RepID=A0ABN9LBA9_9NEOB|nr:unnamed protein product [Ranitomeya imitator]
MTPASDRPSDPAQRNLISDNNGRNASDSLPISQHNDNNEKIWTINDWRCGELFYLMSDFDYFFILKGPKKLEKGQGALDYRGCHPLVTRCADYRPERDIVKNLKSASAEVIIIIVTKESPSPKSDYYL